MWSNTKLRDFFKHYDSSNPNHLIAIDELQKNCSHVMSDDADWVKKYREVVLEKLPKTSEELATRIITNFEGFRASPYICPAGVCTIGYGTTFYPNGQAVNLNDSPISEEEGREFLIAVLNIAFLPILRRIPTWGEMSVYQRAAIMSFSYNLGAHFYGDYENFTTITEALSDKKAFNKVPSALLLYVNPGSIYEEGLKKRRQAEGELWNGTGQFAK